MKRAGRWLFNFATTVSAVLCIVLIVLGIRSFWKVGSLAIDHRGGICFWVEIERGQLAVWKQHLLVPATQPARLLEIRVTPAGSPGSMLVIQGGEKITTGRPKNVVSPSLLGFGAKSVSQAGFEDVAIATLARERQDAEQWRGRNDAISQSMQRAADSILAMRRTQWQFTAPMWSLVAMTLVLPMVWVIRWRRQRAREMLGMCAVCGYDLRATPDRCPECGAIPEGAKGAGT